MLVRFWISSLCRGVIARIPYIYIYIFFWHNVNGQFFATCLPLHVVSAMRIEIFQHGPACHGSHASKRYIIPYQLEFFMQRKGQNNPSYSACVPTILKCLAWAKSNMFIRTQVVRSVCVLQGNIVISNGAKQALTNLSVIFCLLREAQPVRVNQAHFISIIVWVACHVDFGSAVAGPRSGRPTVSSGKVGKHQFHGHKNQTVLRPLRHDCTECTVQVSRYDCAVQVSCRLLAVEGQVW